MLTLSQNFNFNLGSNFTRIPSTATPRYTNWLNGLSTAQLIAQRFREVTLLHPTWFFHRHVWEKVGGYVEDDKEPEDLVFFCRHVELGMAKMYVALILCFDCFHIDHFFFFFLIFLAES